MMNEEQLLLQDFIQNRSQQAFTALVRRYVDLVYSCAKRQLAGDGHAAEDVTQSVFMLLADKAHSIPTNRPLSAWLVKAAGYFAANARRAENRRAVYEQKAGEMAAYTSQPDKSDWQSLEP